MRKILGIVAFVAMTMPLMAGITTYTFTSADWKSKQGSVIVDGKTDGWVSNKAGLQYDKPQYQTGVKVTSKEAYTDAGATSIKSFTNVRRVTFNYATTTSGAGSFRFQIGANAIIDTTVTISTTNTDLVVDLPEEQSGQITFWVHCTTNSIWLASVSIRSEDGESPVFTQATYQLVTDIHSLCDSDQVIFGVADGTTNRMMGYYDEMVSQNNIHAIKAVYDKDRTIIRESDDAIYTLWKEIGENVNDTVYVFQDELRYEQAYLVASGGRTKNKLTLWDDVVSPAYGNYGFWRMTIGQDGAAVIENAGTSTRKYLQYNAKDQLFGCYENADSQTKVCLYRRVEAKGTDNPAIVANMVNFGNVQLARSSAMVEGSKTMEVNAVKLTEDIICSLKHGDVFSLQTTSLDRDGDLMTISYQATKSGKYIDTLVLSSTGVTEEVTVMLTVVGEISIAEAVQCAEYEFVYLNPVVVTKKYDTYVFIRDETGSMLIYDTTNPDTGKPYAQGLEQGHVLSNVQGHFKNYFGVPEMTPTTAWTVDAQKKSVTPETVTEVDSADVCHYVRIENAVVGENFRWGDILVVDKFNTGIRCATPLTLDAIVMIDHDELQLWIVKQEYMPTDIDEVSATKPMYGSKFIHKGQLFIRNNNRLTNAVGQRIK
ncbi:MAG: hypothetical protein MJZ65_06000 [Paludibacteraceae bacterium]|nr:hypothetical protein [Paludibacteraceae bacterium]